MEQLRPAEFCREVMASLEASEGRRRQRKRNTTPDAIGLDMKRRLLEQAIIADPTPDDFENWLFERCLAAGPSNGGLRAVALSILEEWRFAADVDDFREWLAAGAPSDDATGGPPHLPKALLAIMVCAALSGCAMEEAERQDMLESAGRTNYEVARSTIVRDLRSPADSGRLIYQPPITLSQRTARPAGAGQMWAPFGIAQPDTTPPAATTNR